MYVCYTWFTADIVMIGTVKVKNHIFVIRTELIQLKRFISWYLSVNDVMRHKGFKCSVDAETIGTKRLVTITAIFDGYWIFRCSKARLTKLWWRSHIFSEIKCKGIDYNSMPWIQQYSLYNCFSGFLGILRFLEPQSPHFRLELLNIILKYQEILNFLLILEN